MFELSQSPNLKMQNDSKKFKIDFKKRLIRFSVEIIKLASDLRKNRNLVSLADQIIRSATSVGANIIEAKSCGTRKDYIRFFEIALKSGNETKYWLLLIGECDKSFSTRTQSLLKECDEICRIIGAGILTMKGKRNNFAL